MTTQRKSETEVIHARVPVKLIGQLQARAKKDGRSMSNYVAKVLGDHCAPPQ